MPTRTATAEWNGSLRDGDGTMRMQSGSYEGPYSFQSRFKEGEGTNPEELIGAAHAGCFSMAFSKALTEAGFPPRAVDTTGDVPGIDDAEFQKIAEGAKENCPISRLLSPGAKITLSAQLV